MQKVVFHNPTDDDLEFWHVVEKIKLFIEEDKSSGYKLTIGTDSEAKVDKKEGTVIEFITAIVIYRKGFGGRYFWTRRQEKSVATLREKIYKEVLLSLEAAHLLVPELKIKLQNEEARYDLEIHIDVGESGATRDMIREVVGMVTGNGFIARTKPYSYAASNIADKHV